MHDAETSALARAAVLLLLVSLMRWGYFAARRADAPSPSASVLPELLAESVEAADENERRAEPLATDERIDLNRADEVSLDRLPGIGPVTARAIVEAREGGVIFRDPDDLLAVRGIGAATLGRIRLHASFVDPPLGPGGSPARAADRVDVNTADSERLQSLPGIGPALAARIVAERREQMFTSLQDLERVRGIGPATVERLRAHATAGPGR